MAASRIPCFELVPTPDGGELVELYREVGFGQLTLRTIPPGEKVGGHCHPHTDEWWLVARGLARVELLKTNGWQETLVLHGADPQVVSVPRGTFHWLANIGQSEVVLLFWSSRVYDPAHPDKVGADVR